MYSTNISNIGQKIRYFRKINNMSTEELGKAIGKSKTTIVRYENSEIVIDILTIIEICNVFHIDLNDIFDSSMHGIDSNICDNPFDTNLLYLYYISKNGIVISSIEITPHSHSNYVLMKNGLTNTKYKQEYTGTLESNYNIAFIYLTNALTNPGLDKFQIEIDLHSKVDHMYYGMFLGISDNTHRPTARKCIITKQLITSPQKLSNLFEDLKITKKEIDDMLMTKYWDLKSNNILDYVVNVNI